MENFSLDELKSFLGREILEGRDIKNTSFKFGSVVLRDIYLLDGRFMLVFKNLKNYEDEEQEIKL